MITLYAKNKAIEWLIEFWSRMPIEGFLHITDGLTLSQIEQSFLVSHGVFPAIPKEEEGKKTQETAQQPPPKLLPCPPLKGGRLVCIGYNREAIKERDALKQLLSVMITEGDNDVNEQEYRCPGDGSVEHIPREIGLKELCRLASRCLSNEQKHGGTYGGVELNEAEHIDYGKEIGNEIEETSHILPHFAREKTQENAHYEKVEE